MKKLTLLAAAVLLAASQCVIAQSTQTQTTQATTATKTTEWKEKDEFHKVMAQTFHPMEDGNYEPIRKRSKEMHEKALAWQTSTPPADLATEKIAITLRKLVQESATLDKLVQANAADQAINEQLTKLHDTFHDIVGLCQPGDHDKHGHDHGHHGHDHSDPNHKH